MLAQLPPNRAVGACPAAPAGIAALIDAARRGAPLDAPLRALVRELGFDSFRYGRFVDDAPKRDSRALEWTTEPAAWRDVYARNAYIEVDPRITQTRGRAAPLVWDSARLPADARVQRFARDAARFGIRSGVAVSFADEQHARVVVAVNSSVSPLDGAHELRVARRLGDVMLLATHFHDLRTAAGMGDLPAAPPDALLSERERECLRMAAHGMTSADIGVKLGIAERTVNFHFRNVIGKLAALNRSEAVAKAIARQIIRIEA